MLGVKEPHDRNGVLQMTMQTVTSFRMAIPLFSFDRCFVQLKHPKVISIQTGFFEVLKSLLMLVVQRL